MKFVSILFYLINILPNHHHPKFLVPKSQVQNIYNKNNKENTKPVDKVKVPDGSIKKFPKKEKPQEPPKPKAPKSIEGALNIVS